MRSRSIAWRLALAFAMVCALVLSAIGVFLYRSLASEIAYRDDLALLGRLEQVRALLADSDSLDALQARPRLYQNMLGNLDSLLLVRRADGSSVIASTLGSAHCRRSSAIPREQTPQRRDVLTWQAPDGAELALLSGEARGPNGEPLTVIAGKVLSEREQMLGSYRMRLYLSVGLGALLAFALGLVLLRRGLQPLRQLSEAVRGIDLRSLDQRLPAERHAGRTARTGAGAQRHARAAGRQRAAPVAVFRRPRPRNPHAAAHLAGEQRPGAESSAQHGGVSGSAGLEHGRVRTAQAHGGKPDVPRPRRAGGAGARLADAGFA